MQKNCKNCQNIFDISQSDQEYYQKIDVPEPTFCPKCREQRRLAYRNEHVLYQRKSDLSGKLTISVYNPENPIKIYTREEWWSDVWDPFEFSQEPNYNLPFFDQFYKLQLAVPRPPAVNNKAENSEYCNFADGNKNCYLVTSANRNEDCFYGFLLVENSNAVDCLWCTNSELLYECIDCRDCYNLRYGQNCSNCNESAFILNGRNLNNCLFCVNLQNKQYFLYNKPVTKEEYENKLNEIKGSYSKYHEAILQFEEFKKQYPIRRANNFLSCENVTGDNIFNSKNIKNGFYVYDSEDCVYVQDGLKGKDCYDVCFFDGPELCYESTSLIGYNCRFTNFCRDSQNLTYCDNCHACQNCFGCIGLRNKDNCIFNKQYSKEEYNQTVQKIIQLMQNTNEWGEFFPIKYSLFSYNETLANDYFPITKEQATNLGLKYYEKEKNTPSTPTEINILDNINNTENSICNNTFTCKISKENYKIIPQELEFYKKMQLPLPRKSPKIRNKERFQKRNPRKLWERTCTNCQKPIQTTYSPEKPEKIYCERCYLDFI